MKTEKSAHPSVEELDKAFQAAQEQWRSKDITGCVTTLRGILSRCPAYGPALTGLGKALQAEEQPEDESRGADVLRNIESVLRTAVTVERREPRAVVELAWFVYAVQDRNEEAIALYKEAISSSLQVLEDAWVGLIGANTDQEDFAGAIREGERALAVLPDSERIRHALEFARETSN